MCVCVCVCACRLVGGREGMRRKMRGRSEQKGGGKRDREGTECLFIYLLPKTSLY